MNDWCNFTELLFITVNEQYMQQIYSKPGSESKKNSWLLKNIQ